MRTVLMFLALGFVALPMARTECAPETEHVACAGEKFDAANVGATTLSDGERAMCEAPLARRWEGGEHELEIGIARSDHGDPLTRNDVRSTELLREHALAPAMCFAEQALISSRARAWRLSLAGRTSAEMRWVSGRQSDP
jgi:hypothetical protein